MLLLAHGVAGVLGNLIAAAAAARSVHRTMLAIVLLSRPSSRSSAPRVRPVAAVFVKRARSCDT